MCRIPVGRRSEERKIQARGIYPGAKVARGPDWAYRNQDGGIGKFGTVKEITNWKGKPASAAVVLWESGTEGTYRRGYHGKVSIIIIVLKISIIRKIKKDLINIAFVMP